MSVDVRGLEAYMRQLQKLADKKAMDALCQRCAKELAARLLRKVFKNTQPSDDITAELLVWRKTTNGARKVVKDRQGNPKVKSTVVHQGGTLRRGWKSSSGIMKGHIYTIEVYNNVFYAAYVEYGHRQTPGRFVPAIGKRLKKSWVDGKFIMTKAVIDINKIAQPYVERELNKYMRSVLG